MRRLGCQALLLLAAFLWARVVVFADGGTLQFRKQAGPFTVTLFSEPVPLRVGVGDLSVLVQDPQENPILDGVVTVRISRKEKSEMVKATVAQATNKLLYAAPVEFLSVGKWRVTVQVTRGGLTGSATGETGVMPEEAPLFAYWPYFAVVPVVVVLFVLNQWLRRKQRGLKK